MTQPLVYAATPFRMISQSQEICDFIESQKGFPVHPLLCLPPERYNYSRPETERENIYRVCFGLVDLCDEVWIFGVGGGACKEYQRARDQGKPTRSLVKVFDPSWEAYSLKEKYISERYKRIVEEILDLSELNI